MSTRYVWNRYDDEYDLVRSSISNNTVLQIVASSNREIHYTIEDVSRPRYDSVSGAFALRNVTTKNLNDGDNQSCTYFYLTNDEDNVYGDSGDRVTVEYNDSSSIRVSCSTATLYRYRTQRAADHNDPRGSVSSANSGAYPSNGWRSPYWYELQGSDSIDPAAVSLPASIFGGDTVTVTVTPSAGKKYGGTVTYQYVHCFDGGDWVIDANTTDTAFQLTVPEGTNTVQVRVFAKDDLGFASSTWVYSDTVTVTNNLAPTAPGSIGVSAPVAGQPVTVTLTAATDPDGTVAAYVIERRADGGGWQQVYSGPALTFTETVGADWQSVQYRAAAVDDEGAQGPYIESEVLPVRTGAVTLTGPASGQGEHAQPFDLGPITLGLTPAASDAGIAFAVLLDGAETVTASQAAGDEITLRIDPRVMARGAHTLTVTASKEAYTTAMAQYTYTVPAWDGSDIAGGKSGRLEDWLGRKLLPKTLAQDCLGPGGQDMATLIIQAQQAAAAAPLEPVVRAAPPSGSFALSPGVLYDFTQADATALTFTFTEPEAGKAAAYHVMFKCGSTAAAVTLPEGVKIPDGYVIEAGRVYELSILENLLTYQSWEADA